MLTFFVWYARQDIAPLLHSLIIKTLRAFLTAPHYAELATMVFLSEIPVEVQILRK